MLYDKTRYDPKLMTPKNNVLPWGSKVAIIRDEVPEISSIIITPDTVHKEKALSGTVAAVGPEVKYLHPGDYVVFGSYSGTNITCDGIEYNIMKEEDVQAVVVSNEVENG